MVLALILIREFIAVRAKKRELDESSDFMQRLRAEIKRAERFNYKICVVLLEFPQKLPRRIHSSLQSVLPEAVIEAETREYDLVSRIDERMIFLALPYQSKTDMLPVIRERMCNIAESRKWGDFKMGMTLYPDDGMEADEVYKKTLTKLDEVNYE